MNPQKSFTLRPSSAFSAYVYVDSVSMENTHSVVAGTIRKDFGRPKPIVNPEAGLGLRASPFEPLIHDRNLPKSGTISPLNAEEHKAWRQSRQDKSQLNNRLASEQCHRVDDNDEDSWKLRYLQSEIARTHTRMNMLALMEEKRKMRLEILGLQAELYLERSENADKKQSTIKLPDRVTEKNHPVDCDISDQRETLNYGNVTRVSLLDATELDSSANDGLVCCVNTTPSTLDNETPDLTVKKTEGSKEASALVVLDNVQTNPLKSNREPAPSVRITRSRGLQKDAELEVKDVSPEKSETLAEEAVARVRIDDHDNATSDNSKERSSKTYDEVETDPVEAASLLSTDYSVDGMSGMNNSATRKGKRKLKGSFVESFQAPPRKKQRRRPKK